MQQQVSRVGLLLAVILLSMIALSVFSDSLLTNVTDPVTDSFPNSLTAAGATSSVDETTFDLSEVHWFTDLTEVTITGETSGSITTTNSTLSLDAARDTITLTLPKTGTVTEDVTINYVSEDTEGEGTVGWKLVPLFVVLLSMAAIGGSLFIGFKAGSTGNVGSLLTAIGVLFVGVILGEIVKDFTDDAITLYAIQPEYTGIGSLLPLVDFGYVLALFAVAAGGVAGFGSTVFRR